MRQRKNKRSIWICPASHNAPPPWEWALVYFCEGMWVCANAWELFATLAVKVSGQLVNRFGLHAMNEISFCLAHDWWAVGCGTLIHAHNYARTYTHTAATPLAGKRTSWKLLRFWSNQTHYDIHTECSNSHLARAPPSHRYYSVSFSLIF